LDFQFSPTSSWNYSSIFPRLVTDPVNSYSFKSKSLNKKLRI
jgi:hypothetical protein